MQLQETDYYVTGTTADPAVLSAEIPIQTDRGTIEEFKDSFVFQAKDNQTLIDGRLFISGFKIQNGLFASCNTSIPSIQM